MTVPPPPHNGNPYVPTPASSTFATTAVNVPPPPPPSSLQPPHYAAYPPLPRQPAVYHSHQPAQVYLASPHSHSHQPLPSSHPHAQPHPPTHPYSHPSSHSHPASQPHSHSHPASQPHSHSHPPPLFATTPPPPPPVAGVKRKAESDLPHPPHPPHPSPPPSHPPPLSTTISPSSAVPPSLASLLHDGAPASPALSPVSVSGARPSVGLGTGDEGGKEGKANVNGSGTGLAPTSSLASLLSSNDERRSVAGGSPRSTAKTAAAGGGQVGAGQVTFRGMEGAQAHMSFGAMEVDQREGEGEAESAGDSKGRGGALGMDGGGTHEKIAGCEEGRMAMHGVESPQGAPDAMERGAGGETKMAEAVVEAQGARQAGRRAEGAEGEREGGEGVEGEEEPDDGVIRCVCDFAVDDGFTIMCDSCSVWQHGACVGVPTINDVPEQYFCDQCDPDPNQRARLLARRPEAQQYQRDRLAREESARKAREAGLSSTSDGFGSSSSVGFAGSSSAAGGTAGIFAVTTPADATVGGAGAGVSAGGKGRGQMSPPMSASALASATTGGAERSETSGRRKKRSSLPKGTSPGGNAGEGGDEMPAPKEIPSREAKAEGKGEKKEGKRRTKPRSMASRASMQMAAAEQEQIRLQTTLLPQGGGMLSNFGFGVGGTLPGGIGLPPETGEGEEGGEKYESWRYEYTPLTKDRWPTGEKGGELRRAVEELVKEWVEGAGERWGDAGARPKRTRMDSSPMLSLASTGGKDAALLSLLRGAVTPVDIPIGQLPPSAKLHVKALPSSAITLAPSFSAPFSTPNVPASSLCPYPRSTVHGVFASQSIAAGSFIAPFLGEVKSLQSYRADVLAQYARLGVPKPGVRVVARPWSMVVDARQWGSEARFIRSGCHPNAVVLPVLLRHEDVEDADPEIVFGVLAAADIGRRDEIVLPWDWDDQHAVHLLPALLRAASSTGDGLSQWPIEALHLVTRKMAHVATTLLGISTCACEKKKDCSLALMWKLAGLTEKTSVNKGGPKGAFGDRLKVALQQAAEPGAGAAGGSGAGGKSKGGKRRQKVNLGPLLGVRRGWTEAEEEAAVAAEALASRASTPRALGRESSAATREQSLWPSIGPTEVEEHPKSSPRPDTSPPSAAATEGVAAVPEKEEKEEVARMDVDVVAAPSADRSLNALFESDDEIDKPPAPLVTQVADASDSDADTIRRSSDGEDDQPQPPRHRTRTSVPITPKPSAASEAEEVPERRASPEPMQGVEDNAPSPIEAESEPTPIKEEPAEPHTPARVPPRKISLKDLMLRRGTDTQVQPAQTERMAVVVEETLGGAKAIVETTAVTEAESGEDAAEAVPSTTTTSAAPISASPTADNNPGVPQGEAAENGGTMDKPVVAVARTISPPDEPQQRLPPPSRTKLSLAAYMKRRPAPLEVAASPSLDLTVVAAGPSTGTTEVQKADLPQSAPADTTSATVSLTAGAPPSGASLPSKTAESSINPATTATSAPPQASPKPPQESESAHFRFPSFSSALGLSTGRNEPLLPATATTVVRAEASGLGPPAPIAEGVPRVRSRSPEVQLSPRLPENSITASESPTIPTEAELPRFLRANAVPLRFDSPAAREIPTGPRALTSPQTTLLPPSGPRGQTGRPQPGRPAQGASYPAQKDQGRSRSISRPASPRVGQGVPLQDRIKPAASVPASPVPDLGKLSNDRGGPGHPAGPPSATPTGPSAAPLAGPPPGLPTGPAGGRGGIPPRAPRAFQNAPQGPGKFRASWPPPPSGPRSAGPTPSDSRPPPASGIPTGPAAVRPPVHS